MFRTDYLALSHEMPQIFTNCINKLDQHCGTKHLLNVKRGNAYEHLGMTLDLRKKGFHVLNQHDGIKKFIEGLPEEMNGMFRSALAPEYPLKLSINSAKLDARQR